MYLPYQSVHSANYIQPLQAPPAEIKKFSHIEDENRRIFAAMVSSLDQGVGKVGILYTIVVLECNCVTRTEYSVILGGGWRGGGCGGVYPVFSQLSCIFKLTI